MLRERNVALFSDLRGVTVRNTFLEFEGENDVFAEAGFARQASEPTKPFYRQASEPAKPFHRQVSEQTTADSGGSAEKLEDNYQEMVEGCYSNLPYSNPTGLNQSPGWNSGVNNCANTGTTRGGFDIGGPLMDNEYQQMQRPVGGGANGGCGGLFGTTPPVQCLTEMQGRPGFSPARQRFLVDEAAALRNGNTSPSMVSPTGSPARMGQTMQQNMMPLMGFCPNCGSEVNSSHRFCPYCCYQLRASQQSPAPQSPLPPQRQMQMMPTALELVGPVQMTPIPFVTPNSPNAPPVMQPQQQPMSQMQLGSPMLGNGQHFPELLGCLRHFRYVESAPHDIERARKYCENLIRVGGLN